MIAAILLGAVQDYDELPDCANPKVAHDEYDCIQQFQTVERQVRFGPSLFSTPQDAGGTLPRLPLDGVLVTYIEEVGHSWQEYLYETDGRGSGDRLHEMSLADAERWKAGREYQIKRYILSLDGTLLHLSGPQRASLITQICEGYANPLGHEVPIYGAPAGPHGDHRGGPVRVRIRIYISISIQPARLNDLHNLHITSS